MNVAVTVEFKADRKEPLGALLRRVAAAFAQNGLQPEIVATFSDTPGGIRTTSAVQRAIKNYPHLARFERNDAPLLSVAFPPIRRLTNAEASNTFPIDDILALADGVPRSLPFHAVSVHFGHGDFGVSGFPPTLAPLPGIAVGDGWWVNGRTRSFSALYAVEGDAKSKTLPDPPPAIAAILGAFGKPKRTAQFAAPVAAELGGISPIVAKYRRGMKALIERIRLPHDLPPASDVLMSSLGAHGPLKPTLVAAFSSRGYDCRGESGAFTLRRRTAANHVVDIVLDVGTWSRSVTVMFNVLGPGFVATLMPPITSRDGASQYPIGDTENWERIVANIAAIVDELERTFVPEVEAASGPAPAWFEPGR